MGIRDSRKKSPSKIASYKDLLSAVTPIPDNSKLRTLEKECDASKEYEKTSNDGVVNPSNRNSRKSSVVQKEYEMESTKYTNELAQHTKIVDSKKNSKCAL